MGGTGTTGLDIVWNCALHQNSSSSVRDDRHIITWPPVYDVTDQLYLVLQDVASHKSRVWSCNFDCHKISFVSIVNYDEAFN